ncbi:hypothetical protein [Methylocella sp.]|uniref:hypothetical protein n=1 Tax=Methylocella sp. TaxID=1978226 RepID=UPI003784F19E
MNFQSPIDFDAATSALRSGRFRPSRLLPNFQSALRRDAWTRYMRLFSVAFVAAPTLVACVYLYLIASPMYEVDTIFAVRNPSSGTTGQSPMSPGFLGGALSSSSSFERAVDESYAVVQYLGSRDAFDELDKSLKLTEAFQKSSIDWFSRLGAGADHETAYNYFLNHIKLYYDDIQGQVHLSTFGFTADLTYRMAAEMARISERLVNQFNERAQKNMIKLAQDQVTQAANELRRTSDAITKFQLSNSLLDPSTESASFNSIITTLRQQASAKRAEIRALVEVAKAPTPRVAELNNMLAALERQINDEQKRLTGESDALAPLINEYRLLSINQQLAQQTFSAAVTMLQTAMLQAEHQKLYVFSIVPATAPGEAILPARGRTMALVIAATLALLLIARLTLAAIRDHRV